MNSKPKIVVLRMREIIYTVLLFLLVLLLLLCLFLMFSPGHFHGGGQTEATEQISETGETTAGTDIQSETPSQITEQVQTGAAGQSGAGQAVTAQADADQNGTARNSTDQAGTAVQTSAAASSSMVFTPGVYTVPVFLSDATLDVEVTVDANHINAIRLVNLSETVETMYPLMTPALENITSQILQRQTLEGITCPQENRYTSQVLLNAVTDALGIAQRTE